MKLLSDKFKNWLLPLLFGSSVAYMIIDCYHRGDTFEFTIGFFAYAFVLFLIFDVIRKIKYVSGLLYLAMAASVLYLTVRPALQTTFTGSAGLSFNQWFYGVQTAATNVPAYSLALIIGGGFFFVSILYYFTQVIYRSFGTMLIILFPLVIYSKRADTINTLQFVIVLCFYIAILIHNRQMKSDKGAVVIVNKSYSASVGVFVIVITLIVGFMPTPQILSQQEQNNNFFDELTGSAPSGYSNTSSGTGGELSDEIIMYVYSDEPLYLRRQSYDYYVNEVWNSDYTNAISNTFPTDYKTHYADLSNTSIINTFLSYVGKWEPYDFAYPEAQSALYETQKVTVVPTGDYYPYFVCSPLNTVSLYETNSDQLISSYGKNYHGEFLPVDYSSYRVFDTGYTVEYVKNPPNLNEFCEQLELDMAEGIFELSVMSRYYEEYEEIASRIYDDAIYSYQLFNGENDDYYSEMERIAFEVTEQYETEYEKAKALENYFDDNGFTYDPRYIPLDSSPEYFVTESKTGTCGDYATAMTLMARYVGLTARYVEGFVVDERGEDDDGNECFIIREKHSHAYVEVYIPGAGWMVFEPTVDGFLDYTYEEEMGIDDYILIFLRYIAVILFVVFVIYLLRRKITEVIFRIRFFFADNNKAVILCYNRLANHVAFKFRINVKTISPKQLAEKLMEYGINADEVVSSFERTLYGEKNCTAEDKKKILEAYKQTLSALLKIKLSAEKQSANV